MPTPVASDLDRAGVGSFFCNLTNEPVTLRDVSVNNASENERCLSNSDEQTNRIKICESKAVSKAKIVATDGTIAEVPLLFLSYFPTLFESARDISLNDVTDVAISLPCSGETAKCLRELLLQGQVNCLNNAVLHEAILVLRDIGLHLSYELIPRENNEDNIGDVENFVFDDKSESSEDEEDKISYFWDTLAKAPVKCTPSSVCSSACQNDCHSILQKWDQEEINSLKSMFSARLLMTRKNKLMNHLTTQANIGVDSNGFIIKNQTFCNKYLSVLTGISEYILRTVLTDYKKGMRQYLDVKTGIFKTPSLATTNFICWFKLFLGLYGQSAPDEHVTILPYWLKGRTLYKMYVEEVPKPRVALRTFYLHLNTYFGPQRIDLSFPRFRISKYSSHSVCDICVALNTNQRVCTSEAELNIIKGLKNQHKLDFGLARRAVEGIKMTALNFPEDNLYIQVDGMDNAKSYCPRYRDNSKELVGTERLPTKIYGGIVWSGHYAQKRKIVFFLNHDQYENASDMVVTIIYHLLTDFLKDHGAKLPRKLHLNLDNCFRENKNRYLFSWLANLVELHVFQEVTIDFLMKGHTGNEVDQLFSILANEFKGEILTVDDLVDKILNATGMTPKPECHHLWYIFGWKTYVDDILANTPLQNHSRFNSFSISFENETAKLRGKRLPQDTEFVPRAGIRLLRQDHDNLPVGPAEFRIEKIEFDKIFRGLSIFLSKISLERKMSIQSSWDRLREKLEGLPRRSSQLEKMKIADFPRQSEEIVIIPQHLQPPVDTHELRGELCPEVIGDGHIDEEIAEGMDVCIYSEEKQGRPWVGRIVQILDNRQFKLQWYERKTVRSREYTASNRYDGSPYLAELDYDMVMFWLISEPQSRTSNGFSLSAYWLKTIEREYAEYDRR